MPAPAVSPQTKVLLEDRAMVSFSISATNTPTSYAMTGLPSGCSLNTSTGAVTGTPTTSGAYLVSTTATNGSGTSSSVTYTIVVTPVTLSSANLEKFRIWRGDAPDTYTVKTLATSAGSSSVAAPVTAEINGHSFTVASWTPASFVTAWNESEIYEYAQVTAEASGSTVVLTCDNASEDFHVNVTFGTGTDETFVLSHTQPRLGTKVWCDPDNWRDDNNETGVPGSNDYVVIDRPATITEGLIQNCVFTVSGQWLVLDTDFPSFAVGQRVTLYIDGTAATHAYWISEVQDNKVKVALAEGAASELPDWVDDAGYASSEFKIAAVIRYFYVQAESSSLELGLPRHKPNGEYEYRPQRLKALIANVNIGRGNGSGPSLCRLDLCDGATAMYLWKSGSQSGLNTAVDLINDNDATVITQFGGQLGVATDPTETSEVRRIVSGGGSVRLGPYVTADLNIAHTNLIQWGDVG